MKNLLHYVSRSNRYLICRGVIRKRTTECHKRRACGNQACLATHSFHASGVATIHAVHAAHVSSIQPSGLVPLGSCDGVRANHKPKHAATHERNPSLPDPASLRRFPCLRPPSAHPTSACSIRGLGRERSLVDRASYETCRWRSPVATRSLRAGIWSHPKKGQEWRATSRGIWWRRASSHAFYSSSTRQFNESRKGSPFFS